MQAVRIHQRGGPEVLVLEEKLDVPEPAEDEVLVRVYWAGVNYIDTYHRSGLYSFPKPGVLGREASGIVTRVGSAVDSLQVGARVVFLKPGSYAEQVTVKASRAIPVPPGLSLQEACAVMLQGLTAHYLVRSTYECKPGSQVVVHAASGGTGGLVVQMAKTLGAQVIGTTTSSGKVDLIKSLGADHTIDLSQQDFVQEVKRITQEAGAHAVYDGVGKSTWEGSLASVRRRGTLVLFGNASGPVPSVDPLKLSQQGSIFLCRPTLVDHVIGTELNERCEELFRWITQGKVKVRVAATFPLAQAKEAHELLESRKAAGKILLKVCDEEEEE